MPWDRYLPLRKSKLRETGYITTPYVIDAHSHLHLHVPRAGQPPFRDFYEVSDQLLNRKKACFIPTATLIHEMDRYGVDKAVVNCAAGMFIPLEQLAELIRKYPERLIGFCWFEFGFGTEPWPTPDEAAEQIDKALKMSEFKGCGEGILYFGKETWPENVRCLEPMLEVIAKHEAPVLFHSGPAPYKPKITKEIRKKNS